MDYKHYLYGLVWLSVWVMAGVEGVGKCVYTREFRMLNANCFDQDFEEIPNNLNTDIEVLYAAKNRIRVLTNSSFQEYPDLKLLYLTDNFITKIEAGTFSELKRLEVLDLSRNSIRSMPTDLPLTLRTLYFAENDGLEKTNFTLSAAYNLAVLSLAKCDFTKVPSLGVLPNLKDLNLTLNPLETVTPADLAPLCRLERLHLPKTLYQKPGSECQCHRLLTWASQHYVNLPAFNCTALAVDPDLVGCNMNLSDEIQVHKACLALPPPPTSASYLLMAAVVGALLLACLVIFCWWRKGRRKQNSVEDHRRAVKNKSKNTKSVDTLIV